MARFRWIGVVCLLAAGLLPACGDDASDDDRAATISEAPSTTEDQPASDDDAGEPEDDDEAPDSGDIDQAALESRLLTVADLPPGWTGSTSTDDDVEDADEDEFCEEAFAEFESFEDGDGPEAEAEFQKGEPSIMGGAFLVQNLGVGEDEDTLADLFDRLPEAFEQCREFEQTDDDGATVKGTFAPLSFGSYGDDTFAMHMSAQADSDGFELPLAGDFVMIREGTMVMMVASIGFGVGSVPVEELQQIVEAAYSKL